MRSLRRQRPHVGPMTRPTVLPKEDYQYPIGGNLFQPFHLIQNSILKVQVFEQCAFLMVKYGVET